MSVLHSGQTHSPLIRGLKVIILVIYPTLPDAITMGTLPAYQGDFKRKCVGPVFIKKR